VTSGASFDAHEVRQYAADLRRASQRVVNQTPAVVKKGAVNVGAQLREEMEASPSFAPLAPSITFDLQGGGFGAEIGPVKSYGGRRGLGVGANIAYFGGAHGGGGTVPDPQGALDDEAPRMEKALLDLLGEV
jgi:hypothetical protein